MFPWRRHSSMIPVKACRRAVGFAGSGVHGRRYDARHAAKEPVADVVGQVDRLVECLQRPHRVTFGQRFALGIQIQARSEGASRSRASPSRIGSAAS